MSEYMEMLLREECAIEGIGPADLVAKLRAELAETKVKLEKADDILQSCYEAIPYYADETKPVPEVIGELVKKMEQAQKDSERLDWLQSECLFQMTIPQFWVARNGRYSYSRIDDEPQKLSEGATIREAIDAAMEAK